LGGAWQTRAGNFAYNAAGAVTSMQLGNGRWESTAFNNRLQPTQIGLGTTQNATDLLKLNFAYGTTDNNGNVQSQTITVPGAAHPFVQTYTYDLLNRLKSAEEKSNNATTWKQTFTYDRYGNRNFDAANTTTLGSCSAAVCNPTVSTANNRFNPGQGYTYDPAGNTTADAEGRNFVYDAENKQVSVSNSGGVIGQYHYDGDGKRVKKAASTGDDTVFIYDAAGKLVEERAASTGALQTSYVYAGSRLLSTETSTGTSYLTSDNLGSPRVNTDASGTVTARHDYHPFGEEVSRTGYGSDTVRQQFTGYERDSESELDFAQARYYNATHGRFTTTDPILMEPKRAFDPQRMNLYAYVRNNPLLLVDPTGQIIDDSSLDKDEKYQRWKAALLATKEGQKLWDKYHNDKNFMLVIKSDPKRDNGALTSDLKFKDGKLIGATISLGKDIGDRADAARRGPEQYPLSRSLGEARVDSDILAAGILAHEFGHVEDANNRPKEWQIYQEYMDLYNQKSTQLGVQSAISDPAVVSKLQATFTTFGVKDMSQMALQTDPIAERTAIPVIQQSFANRGKEVPKGIQKAIDKLTGKKQ
jgi:RHS repeat-associated protein